MKSITTTLLCCFLVAGQTIVQAAELLDVRRAEKISLTLTGLPLTPEQRAEVIKGALTPENLAESLTKSPAFIEKFAQFWTRILGVQSSSDIYSLRTKAGIPPTLSRGARYGFNFDNYQNPSTATQRLQSQLATFKNRQGNIALNIVQCPDGPLIVGAQDLELLENLQKLVTNKTNPSGDPIVPGTLPDWENLLSFMKTVRPKCEDTTPRIKPYWDPKEVTIFARYKGVETYSVSTEILAKCGAAIEKCNLADAMAADRYSNLVARDMTMEPGFIISHTVADDRPWSEIVTTADTIVTGTYAEWLTNKGAPLWPNFPGKSYEGANAVIFTKPDIYDRKHYRIRRNALHGGVLTTPAYHLVTNGRRAKANRAFEAFLCQKFSVPDGVMADPTDANPDLTKRQYCAFCHKTLEPMATFWNRWPETGTVNYLYDESKAIDDNGSFNGQSGPGAAAFGKTLTSSPFFAQCAIKRAFEFVNGRKVTAAESDYMMPEWSARFEAGQQNLRTVIKAMVLTPEFLGASK